MYVKRNVNEQQAQTTQLQESYLILFVLEAVSLFLPLGTMT
jgi:hypothetical protein